MIIESESNQNEAPWIEKYRPKTPEDLISNNNVIETLQRFAQESNVPNMLFYGPPGTGKTSTIMAYARKLYGRSFKFMVLELNASDDRGIDIVRHTIKSFAETQPAVVSEQIPLKLVILDEADAMTKDAQAALRRMMEKYSRSTRFCLICNHSTNIIAALQSRCTKFKFTQIPQPEALKKVEMICNYEGIQLSDEVKKEIVIISEGDMRKVINTLQSLYLASQYETQSFNQNVESLYAHLGMMSPRKIGEIFDILMSKGFREARAEVQATMKECEANMGSLIEELTNLVIKATLPSAVKIYLLKTLKETEYRASLSLSEDLLRDGLVAAFISSRSIN